MDYHRHYDECRQLIDQKLETVAAERSPRSIYEPTDYILRGGGKRIRAVLVMLACEAVGGKLEQGVEPGSAVEILHNFTLVHDDIMDNADTRRGRSTVHTKWDEGTAILVGDVMIGLAQMMLIASSGDKCSRVLHTFAQGIIDVCEGQALDREYETRNDVTVEEYRLMIGMKTGRLIEMAAEIGGQIGGGTDEEIERLRAYARDIGLAFQIQDDLLDLIADPDQFGKEIGGDVQEGKRTYLVVKGIERGLEGKDADLLQELLERPGLPADRVEEVREMFSRNGILDEARDDVERHCNAAIENLHALPKSDSRDMLEWFAGMLMKRQM